MRRSAPIFLCVLLATACGSDTSSIDEKIQSWCDSRCNFYGEDCMMVMLGLRDCTNCPEAFADQLQCLAENDCPSGGDTCPFPTGCTVGSVVNNICPPGSANNP